MLTESVFAGVSDLFHNMLSDVTLNVRLSLRLFVFLASGSSQY